MIHYRTITAPSVVAQLREFVQSQDGFPLGYILAPRNILPATITLSAWEWGLNLNQINDRVISSFIRAHYDQGREALQGGAKP